MSSGQKRMKMNTRERVVSTDWNRMQSFIGTTTAEVLRWMLSATQLEGGAAAVGSSTTSPLSAMIVNGLWARPEIGTTNLFIEPGVIGMVNPDGSPDADDSPFKIIVDAGVQAAGSLVLTAGAVSTRLDVIECSRVEQVLEADNRDIFNPGTALYSPTMVDKVTCSVLTYRIRVGTPGAGFPGTASGWLPLAVVSVPSSATTWNDVTIWDVRPLMIDLVREPSQVLQTFPTYKGFASAIDVIAGSPVRSLAGIVEGVRRQWRIGGDLAPFISGVTNGQIDMLGANFLENGFAVTNGQPWYVYAVFPHGLPRWAAYSPSSSGFRQPMGPKGILVFSQKAPTNGQHVNVTGGISMPSSFGFVGNQSDATPVMTGGFDGSGNWMDSSFAHGWTKFGKGGALGNIQNGIPLTLAAGAGTATNIYDLVDNTNIPVGAVAVRVRFQVSLTFNTPPTSYSIQRIASVRDTTGVGTGNFYGTTDYATGYSNGGAEIVSFEAELPLHNLGNMPGGTAITRKLVVDWTIAPAAGAVAFSNEKASVVGWRLGQ